MFFTTAVRAPMGSSRLMSPGLSSATVEERKRSGKGAAKGRWKGRWILRRAAERGGAEFASSDNAVAGANGAAPEGSLHFVTAFRLKMTWCGGGVPLLR